MIPLLSTSAVALRRDRLEYGVPPPSSTPSLSTTRHRGMPSPGWSVGGLESWGGPMSSAASIADTRKPKHPGTGLHLQGPRWSWFQRRPPLYAAPCSLCTMLTLTSKLHHPLAIIHLFVLHSAGHAVDWSALARALLGVESVVRSLSSC